MEKSERFPLRGVIEGFYGAPWTHEERLDMIRFLDRHGFNVYAYAPKDDPYLRERWQEDHPPEQASRLEELARTAAACGVSFLYCVSPGLSMAYADPDHVRRLVEKFRYMWERGVRHFGLLFDDIPSALQHEADRARFADLAEAHAAVVDEVWTQVKRWDAGAYLIVCPTQYHGSGNEPYITGLAGLMPPDVDLFWTGRFVCSPALTEGDAARFVESTGRRPVFWDNYPVNDLAMANELHLGPLLHRDPQLYRHARGYMANAMSLAESTKIPLATIGDYLRDPEAYDPEASWRRAVAEVAGEADAEQVMRFADNVRGSFLNDRESPQLLEELLLFRFRFQFDDADKAVAMLRETFARMEETALHLQKRLGNHRLAREIRPWVEKYRLWAKTGQSAAALIDAGRRGRTAQAAYHLVRLKQWLKKAERHPKKVCGHVMKLFVAAVLDEVKGKRP